METIKSEADIKIEVDEKFSEEIFIDSQDLSLKEEEIDYDYDGDIVQVDKIISEILSTATDDEVYEKFKPDFKMEFDEYDTETKIIGNISHEPVYHQKEPHYDVKQCFKIETEDILLQGVKNTSHYSGSKNSGIQNFYAKSKMKLSPTNKAQECPICGKRYTSKRNLMNHMKFHNPERPFQCYHCDKYYLTKTKIGSHIRICHTEKAHNCFVCFRKFNAVSQLKIHMKSHTRQKPFQCNLCDLRFSQKHTLDHHIRNHFRPSLRCAVCERKFQKIAHLKVHMMRKHEDEIEYACALCNASLPSIGRFKRHMETVHKNGAKNAKSYSRATSPKKYKDKNSLKRHAKERHTNEIPPSEEKSESVSATSSDAATDLFLPEAGVLSAATNVFFLARKDGGLFPCSVCGKKFISMDLLYAHQIDDVTCTRFEAQRKRIDGIVEGECPYTPVLQGPFETVTPTPLLEGPFKTVSKDLSEPITHPVSNTLSELILEIPLMPINCRKPVS